MKSFFKFILFVVIWVFAYYLIGRLFNWGLNIFVEALNLDTLIGKLILVSVCSSVLWGILFYPTLFIAGFFIDKTIYANISLILMILLNVCVFYVFCQFSWYMIILGIVHAASTILPILGLKIQRKNAEKELKEQQEAEYKEQLKNEIINSLQNNEVK